MLRPHTFPPGHRIRLAVPSASWPWVRPQPGSGAGCTNASSSAASPRTSGTWRSIRATGGTRVHPDGPEFTFVVTNEVVCRDGSEVVFHRTGKKGIPRTAGQRGTAEG